MKKLLIHLFLFLLTGLLLTTHIYLMGQEINTNDFLNFINKIGLSEKDFAMNFLLGIETPTFLRQQLFLLTLMALLIIVLSCFLSYLFIEIIDIVRDHKNCDMKKYKTAMNILYKKNHQILHNISNPIKYLIILSLDVYFINRIPLYNIDNIVLAELLLIFSFFGIFFIILVLIYLVKKVICFIAKVILNKLFAWR